MEQLARHQRQQCPHTAAEREMHGGTGQHDMELAVRPRETQPGAGRAEEVLA